MDVCPVCGGLGRLLQDTCPLCDGVTPLAFSSGSILETLRGFDPEVVPGMDPALHYLAPRVPKLTWTALGDAISAREKQPLWSVPGECWISLRLDGCGFSKAVRMMRNRGVLEAAGFSERFASCMKSCLRHLMARFNARIGFTQSDEMIVFIAPTSVVRGERQVHAYSGRVLKISTLAAGFVTARFMAELAQLLAREGKGLDALAEVLPHFDCRLGHYQSWGEACALLMWRAYDCSVNGVSDAVFHSREEGRKKVMESGTREKVEWLWGRGHLPLPSHQAYGTLLAKRMRIIEGLNPKSGEVVKTWRGVIDHVEGPVLELLRTDALTFEGMDE